MPRRVTVCPRCHFIEDAPINSDLQLTVDEGTIRLHGTVPADNWEARVRVWAQDRSNGVSYEWPSCADGTPVRDFKLPSNTSIPGVCSVNLAIVHELNFTILATRTGCSGANVYREAECLS